uniref:Uncharacterized protein n=1 Tax=Trichogramma kaykai TaxID=54128 RepID=A0ABD2X9X9_9HYME
MGFVFYADFAIDPHRIDSIGQSKKQQQQPRFLMKMVLHLTLFLLSDNYCRSISSVLAQCTKKIANILNCRFLSRVFVHSRLASLTCRACRNSYYAILDLVEWKMPNNRHKQMNSSALNQIDQLQALRPTPSVKKMKNTGTSHHKSNALTLNCPRNISLDHKPWSQAHCKIK